MKALQEETRRSEKATGSKDPGNSPNTTQSNRHPGQVCSFCKQAPGDWQSPTGYWVCNVCQIETLRQMVDYWRDLAYRLDEEMSMIMITKVAA